MAQGLSSLSCGSCLMPLLSPSASSWAPLHSGTINSGLLLTSLAEGGTGPPVGEGGVGAEAQELLGGAGAGTGWCLCSFTHPSPPLSSPETSDFATTSIGDDE